MQKTLTDWIIIKINKLLLITLINVSYCSKVEHFWFDEKMEHQTGVI